MSTTVTAGGGTGIQTVPATSAVPEFLYQLTKMLTDNNRDIIEWSSGTFIGREGWGAGGWWICSCLSGNVC
jgi:hypothetical protein